MRMLMKVAVPNEGGNEAVKSGQLGKIIGGFLEEFRPEAAYFGVENGLRTAYFVLDMKDVSQMPAVGERFFLGVNALITASPVMNAQDLKAGLEHLKL
jgi:hypothetical protein